MGATTAMDTVDTLATPPDTDTDTVVATTVATTARGPLMLSPPLLLMPRLIPTTEATATATDTTVKCPADSSHPKTILGIASSSSEKWIAQFGLTPTSATSFSATRLAKARNGEQEAK